MHFEAQNFGKNYANFAWETHNKMGGKKSLLTKVRVCGIIRLCLEFGQKQLKATKLREAKFLLLTASTPKSNFRPVYRSFATKWICLLPSYSSAISATFPPLISRNLSRTILWKAWISTYFCWNTPPTSKIFVKSQTKLHSLLN